MSADPPRAPATRAIRESDSRSGFKCDKRPLDDYFRRHAWRNERAGIGRTYVLDASEDQASSGLPPILGFYTLSMASVVPTVVGPQLEGNLPRYPMPVALIGRLAVDKRAHRQGLGELLLMDALYRILEAAEIIGCLGILVDAKDVQAERFYERYTFETVDAATWPRRMFLPLQVFRTALERP